MRKGEAKILTVKVELNVRIDHHKKYSKVVYIKHYSQEAEKSVISCKCIYFPETGKVVIKEEGKFKVWKEFFEKEGIFNPFLHPLVQKIIRERKPEDVRYIGKGEPRLFPKDGLIFMAALKYVISGGYCEATDIEELRE